MAMNRVQFQKGLSMTEFAARYGKEAACRAAVERTRWPHGLSQVLASWMAALRARRTALGGLGFIRRFLKTKSARRVNVVLANIKRSLSGVYHSIRHEEVRQTLSGQSQVAFQLALRAQGAAPEAHCGHAGVQAAFGAATSQGDELCVLRIGSTQLPACKH